VAEIRLKFEAKLSNYFENCDDDNNNNNNNNRFSLADGFLEVAVILCK
jgi:hypothetical protein